MLILTLRQCKSLSLSLYYTSMGCSNSKLDDLPAVSLCRDRCSFLSEAMHHRYAFSDSHSSYLTTLSTLGLAFHNFLILSSNTEQTTHKLSRSDSHLHFHSDSDDDHHSGDSKDSPLHLHHQDEPDNMNNENLDMSYMKKSVTPSVLYEESPISYTNYDGEENSNNNMLMSYMKRSVAPSVLYEQRPISVETVHMDMAESSSSSNYYSYGYANENPSFDSYNSGYGNGFFGSGSGYGGASASFPPSVGDVESRNHEGGNLNLYDSEASSSKPPPSPPRGSGWDFLYPFESVENYYPPHTRPSSRDSKEVREEEGIPDLEDEHDVVKEVYGDQKVSQKNINKEVAEDRTKAKEIGADSMYDSRPGVVAVENAPVEYEVHVVDKKVVGGAEKTGEGCDAEGFKASGDLDVVREIQAQFERASESGNEVAKILEVGKFPYKRSAAYQVSSKVLQVISPSLPRHSNAESSVIDKSDPSFLDADQDFGMNSGNLSSTLQKIYLWEKKLYEEVKVEEKMRVLLERKCRKLKQLDERGAETHKIDATRALVRSLSTKIRMAIQVVDRISATINKLRDEELWPQLNDVVQGLTRMWKTMYECHHIQSQAIAQAKRLDAVAMHKHFSDAQLEATMELEHELLNWTLRFTCWVTAQKGFVIALNNWLMKCLLYVPEETPDGIVPFSPGRLGAPPIFVICNQWAQAMERISEKEVVDSMREFSSSVLLLWECDKLEMQQRMMANKDMEKKVKNLEREDQKIHKELQALDKRMVLASGADNGLSMAGHVVYQSETSKHGSLQLSLQHVFEAMERFVSKSVKAYEELLQRVEEDRGDRLAQENHS